MTGVDAPVQVEHRDRNKHDNRWDNLRLANGCQNAGNHPIYSTNTTGYRGVSFISTYKNKLFRTTLAVNDKRKSKQFATAEEAAIQWNDWARERWGEGEFTYQNRVS